MSRSFRSDEADVHAARVLRRRVRRLRREVPFAELASTLLLFIARLDRALREDHVPHVYFLAREGAFLRRLFDRYQMRSAAPVESRYLFVSRRSTFLPSLESLDDESFDGLLGLEPGLSVRSFLGSLGLDAEDLPSDLEFDEALDLERLRRHAWFRDRYESHRGEQRGLLLEYLLSAGVSAGRVDVVDIGWKGSIQDFLVQALQGRTDLHGWYLGLADRSHRITPTSAKQGLVFVSGGTTSEHWVVFSHFKAIYEALLNADHGSVQRYERAASGEVVPILDVNDIEQDQHERLIGPVQSAIVRVFDELLDTWPEGGASDAAIADTVARLHARLVFRPSAHEVHVASHLRHYENFGSLTTLDMARSSERLGLVRGLLRVSRSPGSLYRSSWPAATLREDGLGVLVAPLGWLRHVREFGIRPPSVWAVGRPR